MECEENGQGVRAEVGRRGVKRKLGAGGARDVRLLAAVPARAPAAPPARPPSPARTTQPPPFPPAFANVNLMEEITFWVCTRRAPCLYRYNNVYKKKDEAHCSKYRHSSDPSYADEVPSPKKKKRKLRLLDNESMSSEGQQNVYFERSHKHQRSWYSSSKSRSDRSDVDFNIKNSSIRNKTKSKIQRKNRTTLHKKNKIITSTPKPTTLRRSLRKTQQNHNSTQLNCSLCIFNSKAINGEHEPEHENGEEQNKSVTRNRTSNSKRGTVLQEQSKNEIVPNGQFEDISDVSGFTANYIRSTKVNSKTPRKVRSKPSRNLVRESQHKLQKDESKIIVCVNKSANTGLPTPVLNQSTDSSQNIINLVTVNNNNNEKAVKVNQATSQIKLLSSKNDQNKESDKDAAQNMNVSFQSKSSGVSRYPTRHRTNSKTVAQDLENSVNHSTPAKKTPRGVRELKSINQNELYDISLVSRTRSGKKIGVISMDLEESGCSQGQANNLTDQVSSSVTKNVASPVSKSVRRKKRVTTKKSDKQEVKKDSESDSAKKNSGSLALSPAKCVGRKAVDKTRQSLKKDSLRDKSGFAACFSDSEEDKPLIRRKFFC